MQRDVKKQLLKKLDRVQASRKRKRVSPGKERRAHTCARFHVRRVQATGSIQDVLGVAFIEWLHITRAKLRCHYCGVVLVDSPGPHKKCVDHADGPEGGNVLGNLEATCLGCNSRKGHQSYSAYVARLGASFAGDRKAKRAFLRTMRGARSMPTNNVSVQLPEAA